MMCNDSSFAEFDIEFFNQYATTTNVLSRGASGVVHGPIRQGNRLLAIKQVMFAYGKSAEEIRNNIKEKQQIWNSLKHKHLMRILSVNLSQLPKVMYIVMEFAGGGSLHETLRSLRSEHIKLPIDVVTNWTIQLAKGMMYLHQRNIVHRDLKPSNILLSELFHFRNTIKIITLKITDFDDVREHTHTKTMSFVGTVKYMAPEVIQTQWFSKASDVWSFGVLTWEMLSGDIPYKKLKPLEIIFKSFRGELDGLLIASSFPEDYKFILKKCWKSKHEERISFKQILEVLHPPEINGLTSFRHEVFVSRRQHSVIEVYDSTTFVFKRRVTVQGLMLPSNLVSCSINKCLYTADCRNWDLLPAILRIDPINGNLIKAWNILHGHGKILQLSVANDSNLILSLYSETSLHEYTADGKLIRTIKLDRYSGRRITSYIAPMHAVKLNGGLFVVCEPETNVVYLLSTKKIFMPNNFRETSADSNSGRTDQVEILKKVIKLPGELDDTFGWPDNLSVDKDGSILVLDNFNQRAVLLSHNLDKAHVLTSKEDGMHSLTTTCCDESTGKWLLTDGHRILVCRVEDEKVDKQIYKLISLED